MFSQSFPIVRVVEAGEYRAHWFIGGRELSGSCKLAPARFPVAEVDGQLAPRSDPLVLTPEEVDIGTLGGVLSTAQQVRFLNCRAIRTLGGLGEGLEAGRVVAQWAISGLNVAHVPNDEYDEVRFQISGLDHLFLTPPVRSYSFPSYGMDGTEPYTLGAELDREADRSWNSDFGTISCTYEASSTMDGYQIRIRFAPMVTIKSVALQSLDLWMREWIEPMVRLTSFATRMPQRLSWLTVHRTVKDDNAPSGESMISGQVFGGEIDQEPYVARRPDFAHGERLPLLSLRDLPVELPALVRRWREIDGDETHPFVELYRTAMFSPALPNRARFLYMAQALEALDQTNNRETDTERSRTYSEKRSRALEEIDDLNLNPSLRKFTHKNLRKEPHYDFAARINRLVEAIRDEEEADTPLGDEPPLRTAVETSEADSFGEEVRNVRNGLSHGNQTYGEPDLRRLADALEKLAALHVRHLLLSGG